MGTFSKGILGGFSGKVGNVVGARWRGKDILRSLPQRGNYVPSTSQIDQRERFKTVVAFLTPIKSVVSAYFGKPQGDKSAYNLATGYYIKEALLPGQISGYIINYLKVLISKGDLRGLANATATPVAGQQVTLSWDDNSGQGNASATDELIVVAYCEALDLFEIAEQIATRDLTTVQLPLPSYWVGQETQLWATFISADQKLAATSTYVGAVTII